MIFQELNIGEYSEDLAYLRPQLLKYHQIRLLPRLLPYWSLLKQWLVDAQWRG